MDKIVRLCLPKSARIIAVSDIHTCGHLLRSVLKKAHYDPKRDYLVIVGDILEHWNNNIPTLRYVMELCRKSSRTHCLIGNNDTFVLKMAYSYPLEQFLEYADKENTFTQMADIAGFKHINADNAEEVREAVRLKFKDELEFLKGLPTALETDEHIFVHAGLEDRPDWQNTDSNFAITVPWYLRKKNPTDKWVIVGHFPTYNFRRSNATNLPVIDSEKKIIDIDGGLSIKRACQLNALLINKNGCSYSYDVIWETPHAKRRVIKDFSCKLKPVYVDWSNQDIKILSQKGEFLKVRDGVLGAEGYIIKKEVYDFDGALHIYQFLSAFPQVFEGEIVSYVESCRGFAYVITQRGEVGWIPENCLGK